MVQSGGADVHGFRWRWAFAAIANNTGCNGSFRLFSTSCTLVFILIAAASCATHRSQADDRARTESAGFYTAGKELLFDSLLLQFSLEISDTITPPIATVRARLEHLGRDTLHLEAVGCSITLRAHSEHQPSAAVRLTGLPGCRPGLTRLVMAPGNAHTLEEGVALSHPDLSPGPHTLTASLTLLRPSLTSREITLGKVLVR